MNDEIESAKDLILRSQGMKVAVFKNNKEIQMLTQKSSTPNTKAAIKHKPTIQRSKTQPIPGTAAQCFYNWSLTKTSLQALSRGVVDICAVPVTNLRPGQLCWQLIVAGWCSALTHGCIILDFKFNPGDLFSGWSWPLTSLCNGKSSQEYPVRIREASHYHFKFEQHLN